MIDENTLYINLKFLYQHRCSNKYQDNFIIYPSIHSIQNKNSNKITPKETKYIHQITESVPNTNSYPSNTKISGTVGYKSFNLAAFRFLPDCRSTLLRQLHPYPAMIEPPLNDPPRGSERDGQI